MMLIVTGFENTVMMIGGFLLVKRFLVFIVFNHKTCDFGSNDRSMSSLVLKKGF